MLVGVPSHRAAVALQRRDAIRELVAVGGAGASAPPRERVSVRFAMARDQADDADRGRGDVWLFPLPAARRAKRTYGLEKFLLCNSFLREAVRRADTPPLVVLADDDTVFNATLLRARMAPFASLPTDLVFGNVEEWFMWDPVAMISTCFAYSSRRWEVARRVARNASSVAALPRSKQECLLPHVVGPFPYAKGHFLGYSLATARRLVSLFDCCGDEAYALGPRATRPIAHPFYNRLLPPSHPNHPANNVLTEDVYYMHLLFKALRNSSLTLLHLTLSEYVVERGPRALGRADVYHKLKKPERWDYVRQRRAKLLGPLPTTPGASSAGGGDAVDVERAARCAPMASKYRVRRGGQLVARLEHCCQAWQWCDLRKDLTLPSPAQQRKPERKPKREHRRPGRKWPPWRGQYQCQGVCDSIGGWDGGVSETGGSVVAL